MARILIVDDSLVQRKILRKFVVSLGHTVVGEAASGSQAFVEYTKLKPDLVTMDLTMDGDDGAEAIDKIIAEFPEARIIVVSARQESEVILDALERGARHFLIKPISEEKVKSVVDSVLHQPFDRKRHIEFIRSQKETGKAIGEGGNGAAEFVKQQAARILIVDDSAVARKILREIVTALGHEVVGEAASGSQAFIEYTRLKPDVVTMDLTMQGLGGAEATSKIIAAYPNARIIVVSAMEERRAVIDALERGARHFIIKPISKEQIAAVLHNVLQQVFDPQKHMERIRKLRMAEEMSSLVNDDMSQCVPPYVISAQGGNLVHVVMNETITLTSFQSFLMEIEEHLTDTSRVLFDFGSISRMNQELLVQLDKLVVDITTKSGMVRSISNNKEFVDSIARAGMENTASNLAGTLRYSEL